MFTCVSLWDPPLGVAVISHTPSLEGQLGALEKKVKVILSVNRAEARFVCSF